MDVCKGKKKKLEKRVWWTRLNNYGGRQVNTSVGVGIRIQFKNQAIFWLNSLPENHRSENGKKMFFGFFFLPIFIFIFILKK